MAKTKRATISRAKNPARPGIIVGAVRPPRTTLPPPIRLPRVVSILEALLHEREEARY
ncbi:MAG TPA: hypothetical protein VN858_06590 [Casimicrobiaceae bacterium]|nr:hypothetical protein [Casimicrobiaceae bacterium]